MRKAGIAVVAAAIAVSLLLIGTAQSASWNTIGKKSGRGLVTLGKPVWKPGQLRAKVTTPRRGKKVVVSTGIQCDTSRTRTKRYVLRTTVKKGIAKTRRDPEFCNVSISAKRKRGGGRVTVKLQER